LEKKISLLKLKKIILQTNASLKIDAENDNDNNNLDNRAKKLTKI